MYIYIYMYFMYLYIYMLNLLEFSKCSVEELWITICLRGYIHLIIRIKNKTYFGFETVVQI